MHQKPHQECAWWPFQSLCPGKNTEMFVHCGFPFLGSGALVIHVVALFSLSQPQAGVWQHSARGGAVFWKIHKTKVLTACGNWRFAGSFCRRGVLTLYDGQILTLVITFCLLQNTSQVASSGAFMAKTAKYKMIALHSSPNVFAFQWWVNGQFLLSFTPLQPHCLPSGCKDITKSRI